MSRRLPVYLVLDTSGGMKGYVLELLMRGVEGFFQSLSGDPHMLEIAWISVITFESHAVQAVPLTELSRFRMPNIHGQGTRAMGEAFEVLAECIQREIKKNTAERKGDWKPIMLLITLGCPTDDIRPGLERLSAIKFSTVGCCALGSDGDAEVLEFVAERLGHDGPRSVFWQEIADSEFLGAFFQWVHDEILQQYVLPSVSGRKVVKDDSPEMFMPPPPPPEITVL